MISLGIALASLFCSLGLAAWLLALSARMAGSARGRFRFGLLSTVLIAAVNILYFGVTLLLGNRPAVSPLITALVLFALQLWSIFIILKNLFALSTGRTFAPFLAYLLAGAIQVGLAFGVVRPRMMEAFVVPTKSMSPTIEPGGRIVVNKLIQPRRWDIVAYRTTDTPPDVYCKRLIGLPGERVRFENGQIYINDRLEVAPAVIAGRCHANLGQRENSWYSAHYDDGETIILGPDEYFFIGDNVNISLDSRLKGPSKRSSLIGTADLMYWPLNKFRILR